MKTTDGEHSSTLQPTPPACESTGTRTFVLGAITVSGAEVTSFRQRPVATDNGSRWIRHVPPERPARTVTILFVIDSLSRFVYGAFPFVSEAGGEP